MKKKIIAVCICLSVMLACIGILQWRSVDADERMIDDIEAQKSSFANIPSLNAANAKALAEAQKKSFTPRADTGSFSIGNPDAPVTILEFSSLSCPHCASFHKGALADIKKDYVDTGKVQFVFRDFPLNGRR